MNLLAFIAAIACALVALVYALPMLAFAFLMRFLGRRFGVRPPIFALAVTRLRWTPVVLWGAASLILFVVAFSGG